MTQYLPTLKGLVTEYSFLHTDPTTLRDCSDALTYKGDMLAARHGHPGLGITSATETPWITGSMVAIGSVYKMVSTYRLPVVNTNATRWELSRYEGSTSFPDSTWSVTLGSQLSLIPSQFTITSVCEVPRIFTYDDRLYVNTPQGLYNQFKDYSVAPALVRFPKISQAVTTLAQGTGLNASDNWLQVGYGVRIVVVYEYNAKQNPAQERLIDSEPSRYYQVVQVSAPGASLFSYITMQTTTDFTASNYNVKIYRTNQFKVGPTEPLPPTEYRLCLPTTAMTGMTQTFSLTLNDDAIAGNQRLYTDQDPEEANHVPPVCRDVIQFKDYFLSLNIIAPLFQDFAMTALPSDGDTFSLQILNPGSSQASTYTARTLPSVAGEFKIESNLPSESGTPYLVSQASLSYNGISPSARVVSVYPGSATGQVVCTARASAYAFDTTTGNTRNVKITPVTGQFDVQQFDQPGIFLAVNTTGVQQLFFTYQSVTQLTTANIIEFEECQSIGLSFPSGGGLSNLFCYFLPGTSPNVLPLYQGDNAFYFSFLPAINSLATPLAYPTGVFSVNGFGVLTAVLQYTGLTFRSKAQLLQDTTLSLVDAIQASPGLYARPRSTLGVFSVEVTDTSRQRLQARKTGSTIAFEPVLTTSYATIAEAEAQQNAVVIARQATPESVPFSSIYAPLRVGPLDGSIERGAATTNDIFIMKTDGIYRLNLQIGDSLALPSSLNLLDSTTQIVASESLQVINGLVYFLSQKGFVELGSGGISIINRDIESDIKTIMSQEADLTLVRSFKNEAKKLYGCYFPTSGKTYVYDIYYKRWYIWNLPFDSATCDSMGRMATARTDYDRTLGSGSTYQAQLDASTPGAKYWQYLRADQFTGGDPINPIDQIDEIIPLTGATAADVGQVRTLTRAGGSYPTQNLGQLITRLVNKDLYYYDGTTYHAVTITGANLGSGRLSIQFASTLPAYSATHSLVVGVNLRIDCNAFLGLGPDNLEQYQEWQVHLENNPDRLQMSFQTDTQTAYSTPITFTTNQPGRTIARTYVPFICSRGRFLYSRLEHSVPRQVCRINGQSYVFRSTRSSRDQRR
jgi:hypothetical protein